jgi:putative peptidoglycan lipid II flippase
MANRNRHPLITGTLVISLGTLASRILGMVRDMATAALLGMSGGGVMDSFVTAFRIPNTFRRLFGEGALAASYLPVLSAQLEKDRRSAWRLASVLMTWLAVLLVALLAVIEGICGLVWLIRGDVPGMGLLMGLTATMMPYMLFICLAAQVAATLQALSHFSVPALAPTILNICWLIAVWGIAPRFAPDKEAQAYAIAVAVLASGVLQLAAQLLMLPRLGFRYHYDWAASRVALGEVARSMLPMTLGLAITQINTLMDSLIAWGFAAASDGPQCIPWLGSVVAYPMRQGAAASIYYGERLYEFPLAILGVAVATAIYPLLSRHAARGDHGALADDLTLGLRLVLFLGVPAGVGLAMLSQPLSRLLFQHGQFTAADTARASRVVACYALGVWAFCASTVVVRGYYALGDRITPIKIGTAMVALNLTMDLTLIWPLAEAGLAVSTTVAASVQVVILLVLFSRRKAMLDWSALSATAVRAIVATMFMALAGFGTMAALPFRAGIAGQMVRVVVPLAVSAAVYLGAYRMLRGRELGMLISGVVGPEFRRASDGGGRDSSRGRRQDIDGRGGDPESERRSGRGG